MKVTDKYCSEIMHIDGLLKDEFTFSKDDRDNFFKELFSFIKRTNQPKFLYKIEAYDLILQVKLVKKDNFLDIFLIYITPGYNIVEFQTRLYLFDMIQKRFINKETKELDNSLAEYLIEDLCTYMQIYIAEEKY